MNKRGFYISYRWIAVVLVGLAAVAWSAWSVSNITAQPPIPHAVPENIEVDCLSCHQAGVAGAPRLAWDHLGRANEDCQQCHAISGNLAVAIPHTLDGRDQCYDCHLDGSGGAPRVAGNHASYAVDTCQMCHPHEEVVVKETEEVDDGPHILYGLEAGKTCLNCHRKQFANNDHTEISEVSQLREWRPTKGMYLWEAYCARCHGLDGKTDVEGSGIINNPEYLSIHDEAHIMQAIIAHPDDPDHAFVRANGGPLKFDDVVNIGAYIRTWGELSPEYGYPTPSFSEDVYPVIEKECGGQCHLEKQKGDWSMAGYEDMMTTGANAPVIIPGDPDNSLLVQKLQNRQKEGEMMPTDRQLKPNQISLIVEWIRAGAPEN
ncbi:MAG: hypothetical protein GY938_13980 [Ketobacter sp.]|nr:hypothetical protein [Ketobacter sp.]